MRGRLRCTGPVENDGDQKRPIWLVRGGSLEENALKSGHSSCRPSYQDQSGSLKFLGKMHRSTRFGTEGSEVQILSPRPIKAAIQARFSGPFFCTDPVSAERPNRGKIPISAKG